MAVLRIAIDITLPTLREKELEALDLITRDLDLVNKLAERADNALDMRDLTRINCTTSASAELISRVF
jgi:hypothetical protein